MDNTQKTTALQELKGEEKKRSFGQALAEKLLAAAGALSAGAEAEREGKTHVASAGDKGEPSSFNYMLCSTNLIVGDIQLLHHG